MKKIYILFAALFLLASCGDVGKILRNEKMRTTDEFLVKKKEPLVLPPNYEEIPEPDTIVKKKKNSDNRHPAWWRLSSSKLWITSSP